MLLLVPILLLLITPAIMLAVHLLRPGFSFQWLIAVLGALLAWPFVLFTGLRLPHQLDSPLWKAAPLFDSTPFLQADGLSWPFALAISTLVVSVLLTAAARARQGSWRSWANSCILAGLGLVAVQAGNPLTLILAWASLDITELVVLFSQIFSSEARERVVAAFSARVGGILLLLWAGVVALRGGGHLSFDAIPTESSIILILAAGLRLGVLPLNLPYLHELPLRRGLGVSLRIVPAASSLVLLVRTSTAGVPPGLFLILFSLAGLAALYGAASWLIERDELAARPFWLLGMSSFVVAAAVRGQPAAALAWSLACLFPGSLLFLAHARHKSLLPVLGLGLLGISSLPFTPAWNGADIYLPFTPAGQSFPLLFFFLAHILFLAGYARHAFRQAESLTGVERWVWVIYPFGLVLLPLAHFLAGWRTNPNPADISLPGWIAGAAALGTAALLWAVRGRKPAWTISGIDTTAWHRLFSMTWIYQLAWNVYQGARRVLDWVTMFLEGEAGILWSFLLLALIFSMLAATGAGG